jgi:hypothetical protein
MHQCSHRSSGSNSAAPSVHGYNADDNALVEALSIMLLEIYFGHSIHSIRAPKAEGCSSQSCYSGRSSCIRSGDGAGSLSHTAGGDNEENEEAEDNSGASASDYTAIAFAWARRERKNMSAAFGGAVKHCITCQLQPRANWRDESFQYSMVEQVLLPMMRELQGCLEQDI